MTNHSSKACTLKDVQSIITHVIEYQQSPFYAKELISLVRQELEGTPYIEKSSFAEVARMCGRTLRDMRCSGKLSLDDCDRYIRTSV